ncbi:hypothetical protein [Methylobacterium sp. Leaf85]|uniref:hypothetical protein n=1 Tax=Methylobacterium sp. Leaf85 TaxID=1736241 RepID=UPI0006F2E0A6|nr:hypothetical protein [Methylobacterium sp. Leaf85]KQO42525.1 hypothetical protein ASF08_13085 [Methylobacterium sp. Leaf85]
MAFGPSALAPALLNWRSRRKEELVRWPDGLAGERTAFRFAEHLSASDLGRHAEDHRHAVSAFAIRHPGLLDWYGAALDPFRATLRFENGAPRLDCGFLTPWRSLTSRVDPDSLVTFLLALTLPPDADATEAVSSLPSWGYYVRIGDHGLDRVLARGLADIHIHFEASDPLPLLWMRLATGRVEVRELQHFSDATLRTLQGDERELRRRREDREALSNVAELRRILASSTVSGLPARPILGRPIEGLKDERILLLEAWQAARAGRGGDGHLRSLDSYLFAKGLFLRRHQQRAGRGPGLTRFRDYLDRGRTLGEKRTGRVGGPLRRDRFERMLSLATEPRSLKVVELRIAPQENLGGWINFFRAWEGVAAARRAEWRARGLEVRFVVHFIRTTDRSRGRLDVEFGRLRQRLDRLSAVLHLFRHRAPHLAGQIVGIDVANLERACPPEVFAPYLQLLRGRPDLAKPFDTELLACWNRLEARRLSRPPTSLPTLGLTYHAGEDFYHPLDGLRAIDGLLRNVLRPGDRIGHGLALGWDIARFERERGVAPLPLGTVLDDMVWLRMDASIHGEWMGHCQVEGDKLIDELARRIYPDRPSQGALERALDLRFRVPRPIDGGEGMPVTGQATDEAGIAADTAMVAEIGIRRGRFAEGRELQTLALASSLIPGAQARLASRLRAAGVVVEANPSSNLATGAVKRLSDHPCFSHGQILHDQPIVTINTDDPGVFGTDLEIEFALMFEAMLQRDVGRERALAALDRSRRLALDHAFDQSLRADS